MLGMMQTCLKVRMLRSTNVTDAAKNTTCMLKIIVIHHFARPSFYEITIRYMYIYM